MMNSDLKKLYDLMGLMSSNYLLSVEARLLGVIKGKKYFVKLSISNKRHDKLFKRSNIASEQICLKYLNGLAVPKIAEIPIAKNQSYLVLEEFVKGKMLVESKVTKFQSLGIWFFLIEQLVAFKKHGILYTDIKPHNVIIQQKPFKCTIIDFGFVSEVLPKGNYHSGKIGYTSTFQSPEHQSRRMITEQALIYQLGMVLANGMTGMTNATRNDKTRGLTKVTDKLSKTTSKDMVDLFLRCVDSNPDLRPKNFEALYQEILLIFQKTNGKDKAFKTWLDLRKPYTKRLQGLGLEIKKP